MMTSPLAQQQLPSLADQSIIFLKPVKKQAGLRSAQLAELLLTNNQHLDKESIRNTLAAQHALQQASERLSRLLPGTLQTVLEHDHSGEDIAPLIKKYTRFLFSIGGDGMMVQLARALAYVARKNPQETRDIVLVGVNSTPGESKGVLLGSTLDSLDEDLKAIEKGDFLLERWPVLSCTLNGKLLGLSLSEMKLGSTSDGLVSHYTVQDDDGPRRFHSSGLLVSTGVGSTGWLENAGGEVFSRECSYFAVLHRELRKIPEGRQHTLHKDFRVRLLPVHDLTLTLDGYTKIRFSPTGDPAHDYRFQELHFSYIPDLTIHVYRRKNSSHEQQHVPASLR